MKKKNVYPVIGKVLKAYLTYEDDITTSVLKALAELEGNTTFPGGKEVFLSNKRADKCYVLCYVFNNSFEDTVLSKIKEGKIYSLNKLDNQPNIQEIKKTLEEIYNNTPVEFTEFEISNPFYKKPTIIEKIFKPFYEPHTKLYFNLATKGGEEMFDGLEEVLGLHGINL